MNPEHGKSEASKVAAIIVGGIVVVIFLVLIFDNNSSPSASSNTSDISSGQNTNPPAQAIQAPAQAQTNNQNNSPQINTSQITASDVAPYLTGVVEVLCKKKDAYGVEQINDTGSGSLWALPDGGYDVVTNEHVIAGNDDCILWIPNPNGNQKGAYYLDLANTKTWNSVSDEAVVPILSPSQSTSYSWYVSGVGVYDLPVSQLNYSVSSLRYCSASMPSNSPVIVVGYPAFSSINIKDNLGGAFKNQITTNGVISGNYLIPQGSSLPYANYYISATIDSGNSGGVAFSKDANGLCLLGIPTWITLTGNFTNEGIIQNIHNVTWTGSN
jgi:hypothetical protein